MRAMPRMSWVCGVCYVEWDSEKDAEWCCGPECDEVALTLSVEEQKRQEKVIEDLLQVM